MALSSVPLLVITNAGVDHHDTGSHPECRPRTTAALRGIEAADVGDAVTILPSRAATVSELTKIHTPAYVASLETFCAGGGGKLDEDTPVGIGSWTTALHSAGSGMLALETLDRGEANAAFVITRPPGHHARPDRGMGFCLFNNVAVAAAHLANRGERVFLLDWDVHHGNGTQEAFWDNDRVLFASLHQSPYYPGSGAVDETGGARAPGKTINIALPAGTTGDVYLQAFDTLLAPAVAAFDPTWVLVSAGFDAHRDDPLADVMLTAGDFGALTRRVQGFAPVGGRLMLFLEGGYDLDALSRCVAATTSVLCDGTYKPERQSNAGPGSGAVKDAVKAHRAAAHLTES